MSDETSAPEPAPEVEDPAELYAVPEDEQLDEDDPGEAHTGGEPEDLSDAPEGTEEDVVFYDDDLPEEG